MTKPPRPESPVIRQLLCGPAVVIYTTVENHFTGGGSQVKVGLVT